MKRAMFIILWALVFWFVTLTAGVIVFAIFNIGLRPGNIRPSMLVGSIWAAIFFGSPLVGLSLGSRGILPGTKKKPI